MSDVAKSTRTFATNIVEAANEYADGVVGDLNRISIEDWQDARTEIIEVFTQLAENFVASNETAAAFMNAYADEQENSV